MNDDEKTLAAEMAAVSVVKSQEIVEAARSTAELSEYQNSLDDLFDRVIDVQRTLNTLEAHEVTPELAEQLDKELIAAEALPEAVEGAEALGFTLLPKAYLATRLAGCESFLSDFFKSSREVVSLIGTFFRDSYVLFMESQESLSKQIDLLETRLSSVEKFGSQGTFILGHRLFNRFKINGKVDENWAGNLTKLNQTLSGLSNNYYLNSKNALAASFSYFGGFAGLTQVEVDERLCMMPVSLPSTPFKECTYPDKRRSGPNVVAKRSVELMGGAYFYDVRSTVKPAILKNPEDIQDFVIRYTEIDHTGFDNNEEYTLRDVGAEVKALSSEDIKTVIKLLRQLLKDWGKVFEMAETYRVTDSDYNDIIKGFLEADISDEAKTVLSKTFAKVVRKNQTELLGIRAEVSNYLTLIVNGMVSICNDSIGLYEESLD